MVEIVYGIMMRRLCIFMFYPCFDPIFLVIITTITKSPTVITELIALKKL